jgi:2-polyprenyl-6-methoxyphenol hydroxylase-like FAD-dependent oxidoreductase
MLLEKAHEIGEIGAGIQLGPNAFSALDSLASAKWRASGRYLPTISR